MPAFLTCSPCSSLHRMGQIRPDGEQVRHARHADGSRPSSSTRNSPPKSDDRSDILLKEGPVRSGEEVDFLDTTPKPRKCSRSSCFEQAQSHFEQVDCGG